MTRLANRGPVCSYLTLNFFFVSDYYYWVSLHGVLPFPFPVSVSCYSDSVFFSLSLWQLNKETMEGDDF